MSQLHARLFNAATGEPVLEAVMVLLATVPTEGAVLVHKGQHYRVQGVEHSLDGALVVLVLSTPAPSYASALPPDAESMASPEWREVGRALGERQRPSLEEQAERLPPMFGCIRCGGAFPDVLGARDLHTSQCGRKERFDHFATTERFQALRRLGLKNPGAVVEQAMIEALFKPPEVESEPPGCTGIAASWCPIHGDCKCTRTEQGERIEDDEADECPLHSLASSHGDDTEDARQEERRRAHAVEVAERIVRVVEATVKEAGAQMPSVQLDQLVARVAQIVAS